MTLNSTAPGLAPLRSWRWHFPIRLRGSKNAREHHHARGRRVARERRDTYYMSICALGPQWWNAVRFPVEIQITRYGPRLLDDDNAGQTVSGVRDEVTATLAKAAPGLTDSPTETRARFLPVKQRKGSNGVEIEIRCIEGAA